MPRKREESLVEVALAGRWPVAAAAAALCFVAGDLIVPRILISSAPFAPLAAVVRAFASIATLFFAAIAVMKYLREASRRAASAGARDRFTGFERPRPRPEPTPARMPVRREPTIDAVVRSARKPVAPSRPTQWSMELLQSIEWKRFEEVVAAYFRAKNFRCETIEYGPDGGVDGRLYFADLPKAVGVFQCKAWGNRQVGVGPVRELLGVMAHEKVDRGYFCATGDFSNDAIAFAAANPIKLITGHDLLTAIVRMPTAAQRELLDVSTTGDYTTPTCASCGIKLVERTIGGKAAWGCRNFPRCRTKIFRKADASGRSRPA